MSIKEFYEKIEGFLSNPQKDSLSLSLNNVHGDGVFSLVIDGTEPGVLIRVFIATKRLKPFDVQFHTHRYPIIIIPIKGNIEHHRAFKDEGAGYMMPEYEYRSFLNGGSGLKYLSDVKVDFSSCRLPIGAMTVLGVDDFHTMSVSKGSIWAVEECGFRTESSRVLGIPFNTEGLYTKPEMFQINDMCQLVLGEVRKILAAWKTVN